MLEHYTYEEDYVSPDLVSPLYMGLYYQFLDNRPKHLEIVLELPITVEVVGYLGLERNIKVVKGMERAKLFYVGKRKTIDNYDGPKN